MRETLNILERLVLAAYLLINGQAHMLVSVLRPGLRWNECAHLEREWETAIESWSPEERREVMTWIGTRDEVAKPARVEQLEAAQSAEEVSHV